MIASNTATDVACTRAGRPPPKRWAALAVAVITGVGGGLLIGVSPAAAAVPGLVAEDETLVASSRQSQSVTAECPGDTKLVNAGGYITGGDGSVAMDDIFPDPTTDSVTVTGKETDPFAGSWRPTAVATCADALPGLEWIEGPSLDDSDDKIAAADCPGEKTLVGTGATIENGFGEVVITTIAPQNGGLSQPADGVEVSAHEEEPYAPDWIVYAFAACADPLPGQQVIRVGTAHDTTDPKDKLAQCTGQVATGGGVGTIMSPADVDDLVIDGIVPNNVGAGVAPTTMTVFARVEDPFIFTWTLLSYALCANG